MCENFTKIRRDYSSFIKIWEEQRLLYVKTNTHFWSYFAHFFLERRTVSYKHFGENQNTRFVFNNFFFRKLRRLWENAGKYCRGQATDDNMAHANCMLDTDTLKICNNHYFSTATMFARKRLHSTLTVHCLSCSQFVTFIATKIRALNQKKKNCKYDNQASSSVFLSAKNHSP
jgi:hypothetical protein